MAATDSDLRQASRAIKDATSALTSVLKQAFAEAGSQASREIADELRDVVKDLGDVVFIGAGGGSAPSQRSQKAERTRAELLVAAAKVFAEKGYEGASVGDIAVAAGYTKGAVYANFGSKQDMLLALAQELVAQDAEAVEAENIDLHEFFGLCAEAEGNQSPLLVLELYLYGIRHPEARASWRRCSPRLRTRWPKWCIVPCRHLNQR